MKKQNKSKLITFTIKDPIFYGSFFIVIGDRVEAKQLLLDKYNLGTPQITNNVGGAVFTDSWLKDIVVWVLGKDMNDPNNQSVLAHEILHATSARLADIGAKNVAESEEVYAYYHTWLYRSILDRLKKKK